ncbi:unnamed protein product [Boreogadus saida]
MVSCLLRDRARQMLIPQAVVTEGKGVRGTEGGPVAAFLGAYYLQALMSRARSVRSVAPFPDLRICVYELLNRTQHPSVHAGSGAQKGAPFAASLGPRIISMLHEQSPVRPQRFIPPSPLPLPPGITHHPRRIGPGVAPVP